MSISYPLSLPSVTGFKTHGFTPRAVVAASESPFTLSHDVQVWPGQAWSVSVTLPPMQRDKAEIWISWRLSLNGREGTFLLGDPDGKTPRGTVGASGIVLDGAHSIRSQTVSLAGLAVGATILAGDYIQLGSGSGARLHKWLIDATADGAGKVSGPVWPRLRAGYSTAAPVITRDTVGLFRMASNAMPWTSDVAAYGISFDASEAL